MKLEPGLIIESGNFVLVKKIENIHELIDALHQRESIFARHRMYASAILLHWSVTLLEQWIKHGLFWTAIRIKNK